MPHERRDRFPGYDVLSKRSSPSWNEQTRRVVDARLAIGADERVFFTPAEWLTLKALVDRIVPQPAERAEPVPLAALVDARMRGPGDGFRLATLPPRGDAWRTGLAALEADARAAHDAAFPALAGAEQDALIEAAKEGRPGGDGWGGMSSKTFFAHRAIPDVVKSYYEHPTAWNEIGWGGPASPRGYVRMGFDRRDPWEATEAKPGREAEARRENGRVGR